VLRRVNALAIVAALLLVTACSRNAPNSGKATPTPSPSPSPTAGTVRWTNCTGGFECGSLQVPLDYANPAADSIAIALIRKKATSPSTRIGSLLTNPGGPGASGIDFLRGEASHMINLNRQFDLVSFDPRGIGQSAPVRCLDGSHEDALVALDPVLDDAQEKQVTITADQEFAAACELRSARILPFVDTVSAANDMELIRQALGDPKMTYLGYSYGTFLGLTYAHLFPTRVRAFALDGVVDPNLSPNDMLLAQVVGFEQNLQAFLSDCRARRSARARCAYAQTGDPGAKLNALMLRLDTRPLRVGNRSLTRGLAVIGVLTPLYVAGAWPVLDQALTSADQGNGAPLLRLADIYFDRNADGTYGNLFDANYAVNCLDRPVPLDIASYDQLGPAFERASQVFGRATQYENLPCAYWPVPPKGHPELLDADGAPPILLVGGTGDPATPYAWAQAVHDHLVGSVLLTRRGYGHTSYDSSVCSRRAMDAYLIDLTLPAEGTVCS